MDSKSPSSDMNNIFEEDQKTLEEALECPICQDLFRDACETTCGHAFCEFCINKWLEKKHSCPVCNKNPSPVHPSWTLRIVTNCFQQSVGEKKEGETAAQEKQLGNDCYKEGKYAEAITHYSSAVRKSTSPDYTLFNNRAQCYIKLGQFRRALDDCDQAIRLDGTLVKAHIRRSKCLEGLADIQGAISAIQAAQQLDKQAEYRTEIEPTIQRLTRGSSSSSSSSSSSRGTSSSSHSNPHHQQQEQQFPGFNGGYPFQQFVNRNGFPNPFPQGHPQQQQRTAGLHREENSDCVIS